MTCQASSWGSFVVFIVGVWGINQAVVIKARGRCCFGAGGLMDVWRKTGHPAARHKQVRVFRSARWDRGLRADYTPPRQEAIVWINSERRRAVDLLRWESAGAPRPGRAPDRYCSSVWSVWLSGVSVSLPSLSHPAEPLKRLHQSRRICIRGPRPSLEVPI